MLLLTHDIPSFEKELTGLVAECWERSSRIEWHRVKTASDHSEISTVSATFVTQYLEVKSRKQDWWIRCQSNVVVYRVSGLLGMKLRLEQHSFTGHVYTLNHILFQGNNFKPKIGIHYERVFSVRKARNEVICSTFNFRFTGLCMWSKEKRTLGNYSWLKLTRKTEGKMSLGNTKAIGCINYNFFGTKPFI